MTSPRGTPVAQRGFHLALPEGFVELPLEEIDLESTAADALTTYVAERFGLPPDDDNTAAAAAAFAQLGELFGESGGIDYAAIGFYKSPDDPLRPIMVTLAGAVLPSDHFNASEAVTGLLELHSASGAEVVEQIQLPAGPAVATVTEEQNALVVDEEPIRVLTRQLSAWVPDREGTTIGVLSAITNSFQDWERVCVLALDIFDTFGWEPHSG